MTWLTGKTLLTTSCHAFNVSFTRPFKIIAKPDGRPAVEVDDSGKKTYVCTLWIVLHAITYMAPVRRRAFLDGSYQDEGNCGAVPQQKG